MTNEVFESRGRLVPRSAAALLGLLMLGLLIEFSPRSSSGDPIAGEDPHASATSYTIVDRVAVRDSGWLVLSRDFTPSSPDWSLVLWRDSATRPGHPDPDEILVLEHRWSTRSIVATMYVRDSSSTLRELPVPVGDHHLNGGLRGDLDYRSLFVCASGHRDLEDIIAGFLRDQALAMEPAVLPLTAHHF